MTKIHLCHVPHLSNNYQHVLDFKSYSQRRTYFESYCLKVVEQSCQISPSLTELTVGVANGIGLYNYLFLEGETDEDDLFFFINGESPYSSRNTTKFHIELDVFSTYWIKCQIKSAFVERMHVDRWDNKGFPTREIESEPIQTGYHTIKSKSPIHPTNEGVYIYITSSPLGDMKLDGTGGDNPDFPEGGGNCKATGILSYNGFRFIKGYEGFTHTGSYLNGESFRTVGYGFTEKDNLDGYNAHKPFPCSEEKASELYGQLVDEYASQVWKQCQADGIADLLTYYMFDAMVSLAWNVGVEGFLTYDKSPYQLIRVNPLDPQIESVWKSFATTGSGVPMEGLVIRRRAEANVYFTGQYVMKAIINVLEGDYIKGDGFIPSRYVKCNHMTGDNILYEDGQGNMWALPLDKGYISACYGSYPDGGSHYGIDFTHETRGAIRGANIYAPKDGMVVQNVVGGRDGDVPDKGDGFGNYVCLYDPLTDSYHIFGHMLKTPKVKIGQTVNVDTVLGQVGTSGYSTGYHLHWEVRYHANNSSSSVNPIKRAELNKWYYRKGDEQ